MRKKRSSDRENGKTRNVRRKKEELERENKLTQRQFGESCFYTPRLKNSKVFVSPLLKSLEASALCKYLGFLRN